MKTIFALALLAVSTVSMANSVNALIANDIVVKGVLKSIEKKSAMKCAQLNIKIDRIGVFTATTSCLTIDNSDGLESSVMVEINGQVYGDTVEPTVMIESIKMVHAG